MQVKLGGIDDNSEFKLDGTPTDTITSVKFNQEPSNLLLVSSWDSWVTFHDVLNNKRIARYNHCPFPALDCCFQSSTCSVSGGLDGVLKIYDFNIGRESHFGNHEKCVSCVDCCVSISCIASGSWDKTVKMWDVRSKSNISTHFQSDKVYSMDSAGYMLVVGTASRQVIIWDLRNMKTPQQVRESSLKHQTRCIRCFPNKEGYALSSVEGKIGVEYFDKSPDVQKKQYAFKCHRIKQNNTEKIYSIEAISFHNKYNTFASGGTDGYVNIWDGLHRKKISQFGRYPGEISSLSFNHDGSILAIGVSQSEGSENHLGFDNDVFIRNVTDQEVKLR